MYMKNAQIASKVQGQADRTSLFSRPSFTFDSDRPQNTGDSNYIRCKDFSVGCGARLGARSGFTLMELVVYIAIMGIVVIVAGQAFSNSTKFRVRNQSMIEANEVAGNISAIIRDDVAQMGAKSSKETPGAAASDEFSSVYSDVYMNPATDEPAKRDSSSFKLVETNDRSDLTLRRLRYDSDGHYVSVEEVRWFVENDELKRSCWTVAKKSGVALAADDPCAKTAKNDAISVVIADGVTSFKIEAGKPKIKEDSLQMFPRTGNMFMLIPRYGENHYNIMNVENDSTSSRLSGFALNYDKFNNKLMDAANDPETVEKNQLFAAEYENVENLQGNTWKTICSADKNHFTFDSLVVYEISFKMPPPPIRNAMEMFTPGRDFLAVGFRDNEGNKSPYLKDFLFYPPTTQEALGRERKMRFSVPQKVEGQCLTFTFVSYSPVTSEGTMFIDDLKLKRVATVYDPEFPYWNTEGPSNIVQKKNVKAFKITLTVQRNGEGGVVETVIPTPSNGPKD